MAAVVMASVVAGCASVEEVESRRGSGVRVAARPRAESAPRDEGAPQRRPKADKRERRQRNRRPARGTPAFVTRVVDGDTIEVSLGGRVLDVRLIGVDTPESLHPFEPVECFGPAASEFTRTRLEGANVRLTYDVERRDRYGRTLAYVHEGGRMFNETLVARGYAQVSTYPPNVEHTDRFIEAQRKARRAERGLWGGCPREQAERSPAAAGGGSQRCDPNYEGACIPPYPPDLDCGDVAAIAFRSVGSDPHGFDGDGDGVACE